MQDLVTNLVRLDGALTIGEISTIRLADLLQEALSVGLYFSPLQSISFPFFCVATKQDANCCELPSERPRKNTKRERVSDFSAKRV